MDGKLESLVREEMNINVRRKSIFMKHMKKGSHMGPYPGMKGGRGTCHNRRD